MTERGGRRESSFVSGPGIMILTAAIFGYFGFHLLSPDWRDVEGRVVPIWLLQTVTLRGATVAFAVAAGLTMVRWRAGNLLFSCAGLLSSALLVIIAVMDWLDTLHAAIADPVLLLLFAAWNGYASWAGFRAAFGGREAAPTNVRSDRDVA